MKSFILLCALIVAGCGHSDGDIDETIGDTCSDDRDCDQRCFLGGDFPGGFCSLACETDNDCPGDTFCMSESGGVHGRTNAAKAGCRSSVAVRTEVPIFELLDSRPQ